MLDNYIPDIDAYLDYWIQLGVVTQQKMEVEDAIDTLKAAIIIAATEGQAKPPSMAQMERTILVTGSTEEEQRLLEKYKIEMINIEGKMLELRGRIKAEEMKQAMFQTISANSRNTFNLETPGF